jgi:hypothetical protein
MWHLKVQVIALKYVSLTSLLMPLQSEELLPRDATWKEVRRWLHNASDSVLLVLENTEDVLRHRGASQLVRPACCVGSTVATPHVRLRGCVCVGA